ncbi:MAG: radical SAM protein [Candidatus Zixiibacteriota bacterium]
MKYFTNPKVREKTGTPGINPSTVDLFLTYNCNSRCPYCFVRDRGTEMSMTPEIVDRAVDWVAENGRDMATLVFIGGEPTLEPELIERAIVRSKLWEQRKSIKFGYTMTTNAIAINLELAEKLAELNVHYMISVDGFGERHDRSRPTKSGISSFNELTKKFDLLRLYQKRIAARVTTTPVNVSWLREDLENLYRLGFDHFIVSPVTGIKWPEDSLRKYITELSEFANNRMIVNGQPVPRLIPADEPPKGYHYWGCGAGRGRFSIDARGEIFACARFVEIDSEHGLSLGNIFDGIDPDGNIKLFQDTSYESRPECIVCSLRELCLGGCPAVNYQATGSIIKPSSEECRLSQAVLKILDNVKEPLQI